MESKCLLASGHRTRRRDALDSASLALAKLGSTAQLSLSGRVGVASVACRTGGMMQPSGRQGQSRSF
eukprot:15276-Prymnesium_polylepis.3